MNLFVESPSTCFCPVIGCQVSMESPSSILLFQLDVPVPASKHWTEVQLLKMYAELPELSEFSVHNKLLSLAGT